MIVYNVTVNIESSSHDEWLQWMKDIHIPEVMKTGFFSESRMFKILGDDESGGHTYSIQYSCSSIEKFREYEKTFAPKLRQDAIKKFGDKFVAFRTLLQSVE